MLIPALATTISMFSLAQLVDLLPSSGWNVLFAAGMLAPFVGLLISLATRSVTAWKRVAVVVFYVLSLPLGGIVFLAQTENPAAVCPFIILMPVGVILGFALLVRRAGADEQIGFEVLPKRDGEGK